MAQIEINYHNLRLRPALQFRASDPTVVESAERRADNRHHHEPSPGLSLCGTLKAVAAAVVAEKLPWDHPQKSLAPRDTIEFNFGKLSLIFEGFMILT